MLLRSNGRVRFLRLTPRLQICIAALFGLAAVWIAGGTVFSLYGQQLVAERDSRLEQSRVAYEDLLDEIGIYQRKVAEVTGKLRQNQQDLFRQFAWADELEAKARAKTVANTAKSPNVAAITESRSVMRQHLTQLETDLRSMTGLDFLLKDSLNSIRSDLQEAAAERKKGYQARANLLGKLERYQVALRQSEETVAELRAGKQEIARALAEERENLQRIRAARSELAESLADARRSVAQKERENADLETLISETRQELALSHADYDRISSVRAELDVRLAATEGAMKAEVERSNQLEASMKSVVAHLARETGLTDEYNPAREPLDKRAAYLLDRLSMLHEARTGLIETLNERTTGSIEDAERIVGMTGLNVDTVVAGIEETETLGKGGPFIAALPDSVAGDGFAGKVTGLDDKLTRLGVLQIALRAIPLVAPVDAFRIGSGFGKRKDPISGKLAIHDGVDFSAPRDTPIYASAPGTVVSANWNGRYGRMVEIDHGFGIRSRYAHLQKILVKKGQRIGHREKIALLGSSGRSTGPHLHYEILYGNIAMDPMRFIKAGKYVFKE